MALSNPTGTNSADSIDEIRKSLRDLAAGQQSFQTQLNSAPQYYFVGDKFPGGAPAGSLALRQLSGGGFGLSVAGKKGFGSEVSVANAGPDAYLGAQSGTGAPTTAKFPTDGNYGWWTNTSTSVVYWTINIGGTMKFPDFVSITGAITDTQHGARAGGTLHSAATTSVNGFLAAADKVNYDATVGLVSSITNTGAPSTILNGTILYINGQVAITQRQQITSPAATAAGAAYDQTQLQTVVTLVNELRTKLLNMANTSGSTGLFHV